MNASLASLLLLLIVLAALCLWLAVRVQRRTGVASRQVVYDDASAAQGRTLVAARYGLSGKPDYLLEENGALIPVEVKSSAAPGQPHRAHVLQLAAYFLLIEEALGRETPYGHVRYRNRSFRVRNTPVLRQELLRALREMRAALRQDDVARNHQQPQRCARCSVAHACDQRLA